jgi:hypothetical protein
MWNRITRCPNCGREVNGEYIWPFYLFECCCGIAFTEPIEKGPGEVQLSVTSPGRQVGPLEHHKVGRQPLV